MPVLSRTTVRLLLALLLVAAQACAGRRHPRVPRGPLRRCRSTVHQRSARADRRRHGRGNRPPEGHADQGRGEETGRLSPPVAGAGQPQRAAAQIPGNGPGLGPAAPGRLSRRDAQLRPAVGPRSRHGRFGQYARRHVSRLVLLFFAGGRRQADPPMARCSAATSTSIPWESWTNTASSPSSGRKGSTPSRASAFRAFLVVCRA